MRLQHVIIGVVSLVLAGCARLVPPDSIVALEVGPQQVNVLVGATTPIRIGRNAGRWANGETHRLTISASRTSDSSVARVTQRRRREGIRLGRASISATLSTPGGLSR